MFTTFINGKLAKRRADRAEDEQKRQQQAKKAERERNQHEVQDIARSVYLVHIKACQSGVPFRRKIRQPGMRIRLRNYFNTSEGAMETRIVVRNRRLGLTCTVIYTKQARLRPPLSFSYS